MEPLRQRHQGTKPPPPDRPYKTRSGVEFSNRRAFQQAAMDQRVCQSSKCLRNDKKAWEPHHVVEQQWLKQNFKAAYLWDTRNALRLCPGCHAAHTRGFRRILLQDLRDDNYEFAFGIMGAAAFYYLRRKYDGKDPRLEEYLQREEGKTDGDTSTATE